VTARRTYVTAVALALPLVVGLFFAALYRNSQHAKTGVAWFSSAHGA
jgi:hypothetical protein